ncbi:MAG: hypothetical protein ACI38O_06380 [Fibrobacter intestinalis]|uniref:hypothetical protein n=1 Tax=Fibrobacter intestinalis TaxID=28122 RepID=UPI003F11E3C6
MKSNNLNILPNSGDISGTAESSQGKITKKETKADADNKYGLMQRLFGCGSDAKFGIAGIGIIGVLVIGFLSSIEICINYWIFDSKQNYRFSEELKNTWTTFIPVLTLALGYIFGRGK